MTDIIPVMTESLPSYALIISRSNLGDKTKAQYIREIDKLTERGIDPRDRPALAAYAYSLPKSSRAFLKAALKLLFEDIVIDLEANATADNLPHVQASLLNISAIGKTIKIQKDKGSKAHLWLSRAQVEEITSLPDRSTPQGRRDWIVLALLLGAGLRRSEMVELTFDNLKRQPMTNGQMRGVLDVTGKGEKKRVIPISALLEERIHEWRNEAGLGLVARSVNKSGVINGSLSDKSVNDIVAKYGAMIGLELEAHDMRRTYARLGYEAGVPVEQISKLLGHSDIKTTMLYLGISIDLEKSVSDFIPLSGD